MALAAIVASVEPAAHPELVGLLAETSTDAAKLAGTAVDTAAGERLQVPALVQPAAVVAGKVGRAAHTLSARPPSRHARKPRC